MFQHYYMNGYIIWKILEHKPSTHYVAKNQLCTNSNSLQYLLVGSIQGPIPFDIIQKFWLCFYFLFSIHFAINFEQYSVTQSIYQQYVHAIQGFWKSHTKCLGLLQLKQIVSRLPIPNPPHLRTQDAPLLAIL